MKNWTKRRVIFFIITLSPSLLFPEIIKLVNKVPLFDPKQVITYPQFFSVTEDEVFIVNDTKDHVIRIFNNRGEAQSTWGGEGTGKGAFQGAWWNDYSKPFFVLYNLRSGLLYVYERVSTTNFVLRDEIPLGKNWSEIDGIAFDNRRIFVDGPLRIGGIDISLSFLQISRGAISPLLPAAIRYGLKQGQDYEKVVTAFAAEFGKPFGFIDIYGDTVYSVWIGEPRITSTNILTGRWAAFGELTKNYVPPIIHYINPHEFQSGPSWRKEDYSWIQGVFADKRCVGLLFINFDKDANAWRAFLQLYTPGGKFLKEAKVPEYLGYMMRLRYFYDQEQGFLYILKDDKGTIGNSKYEILKFRINIE